MRKQHNGARRIERMLLRAGHLADMMKAGEGDELKVYFGTEKAAVAARSFLIKKRVAAVNYKRVVTVSLDAREEKQRWKGKMVA